MAATNINRVILTGNLTRDPDLRSLPSGNSGSRRPPACKPAPIPPVIARSFVSERIDSATRCRKLRDKRVRAAAVQADHT